MAAKHAEKPGKVTVEGIRAKVRATTAAHMGNVQAPGMLRRGNVVLCRDEKRECDVCNTSSMQLATGVAENQPTGSQEVPAKAVDSLPFGYVRLNPVEFRLGSDRSNLVQTVTAGTTRWGFPPVRVMYWLVTGGSSVQCLFRESFTMSRGRNRNVPIETSGETSLAEGGSMYAPRSASRSAEKFSGRRDVT